MPDPEQTSRAAIALGSNLSSAFGDRERNLFAAIDRLQAFGQVVALSQFFDTAPVGPVAQPRFLNAALLLETSLSPHDLLHVLLGVERAMGRTREDVPAKGPRIIDLDLLCFVDGAFAGSVLSLPDLVLPHPALAERRFVLEPLAELAPDWKHPVLRKTVAEMLVKLQAEEEGTGRSRSV